MKRALPLLGILLVALSLLAAGCASIDWDAPKPHSTSIGRAHSPPIAAAMDRHPEKSGLMLVSDGIEAFSARLLMIHDAQVSVDAQYYFILNDVTGHAFFRELLRAADRGVRVRLLLDDIATQGYDPGLAALDSLPNFEVRIFNPFTRGRGRLLSGVSEFRRVNRRMHNKSLTVDGVGTLIGGRNIGGEYFAANEEVNFDDLDVLAVGPVADQAGTAFDSYWNSEAAVPISVLVGPPEDPESDLARVRQGLDGSVAELEGSKWRDALESQVLEHMQLEPEALTWAPAQLFYDAPQKSRTDTQPDDAIADQLRAPLRKAIQEAESELLVVSPYFVPLDSGTEALCELAERGVRTAVLTNSLAATDVAAVHAGYAPYRKQLLACGVELYEVRPDSRVRGTRRGGVGMSQSSLHAKGFVVDGRRLFVGSFNWDPRSAGINTEMGVLMESPELSREIVEKFTEDVRTGAYRLSLEDGRIRWTTSSNGEEIVLDKEPDTSFWRRFTTGFLGLFPIEEQL